MGKVSNALLMLKLLSNGKLYTIKELSEIIEVTPRQIRNYKDDLEKAGIYIESYSGKHGGYYYPSYKNDKNIAFDLNELNSLENIFLSLDNNNKNKEVLYQIIEKIRDIVLLSNSNQVTKNNADYIKTISSAIVNKETLILVIKKKNIKEHQRTFIPYSIYSRDNNYFVTGYSNSDNEIRTFPFYEIKKIEKK